MTLLLVSVFAAAAMPVYGNLVANGRIRTETSALFHAMHVARKESHMRRTTVSICPSTNGTNCIASRDWSSGWIVFNNQDQDEPPQRDTGEALLQSHRAKSDVQVLANRRGFTFRALDKRATNGTILVCDHQNRGTARALIVSYTGRPRVASENSSGEQYTCRH